MDQQESIRKKRGATDADDRGQKETTRVQRIDICVCRLVWKGWDNKGERKWKKKESVRCEARIHFLYDNMITFFCTHPSFSIFRMNENFKSIHNIFAMHHLPNKRGKKGVETKMKNFACELRNWKMVRTPRFNFWPTKISAFFLTTARSARK